MIQQSTPVGEEVADFIAFQLGVSTAQADLDCVRLEALLDHATVGISQNALRRRLRVNSEDSSNSGSRKATPEVGQESVLWETA